MWPPIHVSGEILSRAEIDDRGLHELSNISQGAVISEQRTMVRWFPGVEMYRALGMAARSGMENVIRLLIAAGNDSKFLDRNTSLSRLMSQLRVS